MSEVKVPPEIKKHLLRYHDNKEGVDLAKKLVNSIEDRDNTSDMSTSAWDWENCVPIVTVEDRWLSQQSRDTWVRVLRWLAMEVI